MIYLNYFLATFSSVLDFRTEISFKNSVTSLVNVAKPLVLQVLTDVKNGSFPLDNYTFRRNPSSNLTGKPGLYLLINKETKKLYLGGTTDLALRKADYNRNFNTGHRLKKVYSSMRPDLEHFGQNSFYFVPLVVFSSIDIVIPDQSGETVKKQLGKFFDQHVETHLLTEFIDQTSPIKNDFYNTVTIGAFQPNNNRGGSPQSGAADKALRYKNLYAWESIKGASESILVDRKSIRNKLEAGIFVRISQEEFNNFSGIKITNREAKTYFEKPENRQLLIDLRSKNLNLRTNNNINNNF
uniref:Putative GIY-YIG homing endonuclease n=1 Tax=Chlamydomonas applanata TaxID=35704 RepID=A0A0S2LPF9_CHLAP|nr:putative GIY-YIG homing endonuclease [Chlamydomonas applanata]ALO63252.1 putative GIY-YIG homing endonucleasee [Chlamydomonas applanata]